MRNIFFPDLKISQSISYRFRFGFIIFQSEERIQK